jgi:hypothetical protein
VDAVRQADTIEKFFAAAEGCADWGLPVHGIDPRKTKFSEIRPSLEIPLIEQWLR